MPLLPGSLYMKHPRLGLVPIFATGCQQKYGGVIPDDAQNPSPFEGNLSYSRTSRVFYVYPDGAGF